MEVNTEKIFTNLKNEIIAYFGLKWHLWKLMAIERTAGLLSSLSHLFILILFLFFTFLFLFIALGFFIGEWLGSIALGFLVISLLYLTATLIFVLAKREICKYLINLYVSIFQVEEDEHLIYENRQRTETIRSTCKQNQDDPAAGAEDKVGN